MAIDELEKELSVITQAELVQLMGGNGSGLGMDASMDEVINYLQDIGVPLIEDSSGNFFFNSSENAILIEEVTVYAYSTGSSGYEDSTGYSSGIHAGSDPLSMVIGYLQSYGYSFSADSNGNYTYHANNSESSSSSNGDPWQRDANGNILATKIEGKSNSQHFGDYEIFFQEYQIDGTDIIAYKVVKVLDINNNEMSSIPDEFKSNCHGYTFADGQFWFNDPYTTSLRDPNYNEMAGFESMLRSDTFYTSGVSKSEADAAVIWTNNGDGWMWHSAKIDANGNYVQKNDNGSVFYSTSESQFLNDSIGSNDPSHYTVIYYKKK